LRDPHHVYLDNWEGKNSRTGSVLPNFDVVPESAKTIWHAPNGLDPAGFNSTATRLASPGHAAVHARSVSTRQVHAGTASGASHGLNVAQTVPPHAATGGGQLTDSHGAGNRVCI